MLRSVDLRRTTPTLLTRPRSPPPLHRDLRVRAGLLRSEGRKHFTQARLLVGDTLCAEAEAVFITARPGRIDQLQAARERLEERLRG